MFVFPYEAAVFVADVVCLLRTLYCVRFYCSVLTLCICWLLMSLYFAIETAVFLYDIMLVTISLLCVETLCSVLCYCGLF